MSTVPVIAVVAMGEMGAGIAARFVHHGARVLTSIGGRSETSLARARAAGVECVEDEALVDGVDMLLSVVPPHAAMATAERFLPLLAASAAPPVFVDLNAIAPQTLSEIAARFAAAGLTLTDGSIIGTPPKPTEGRGPRFYFSAESDAATALFAAHGFDAVQLSATPGDASALKMSYAGITKGFQALAISMALGAARNDAAAALQAELRDSQPELYTWLSQKLPAVPAKAYRWDGEMLEIARFLAPETGAVTMLSGAAALFREVASAHAAGPQTERMAVIADFTAGGRL